jgi:hypothetical protein
MLLPEKKYQALQKKANPQMGSRKELNLSSQRIFKRYWCPVKIYFQSSAFFAFAGVLQKTSRRCSVLCVAKWQGKHQQQAL